VKAPIRFVLAGVAALLAACAAAPQPATPALPAPGKSVAELLEAAPASDWRRPDPENTLYMDLASGRVVIELAPAFAPKTVENIRTLVRQKYFDGLAVVRVQDNFVAQWGDADDKRELGSARKTIPPEFTRSAAGLAFSALPDPDTYAPQTGFVGEFPAARDPASDRAWLVHCYAMVGVGRGNDDDSGNGSSLYAVIGNAPRRLDRNITVAGRILRGIELLSSLPRGTGNLGFYEKPEQRTPIRQVRIAADVPAAERIALEILRTDSETFKAVNHARRHRSDAWYKAPAGVIDVCSAPITVRTPKP
jgi:peptidylprolyl isomerase